MSLETTSDKAPRTAPWRRAVGTAAGVFLGAVLLVATWGKALDPSAFVETIRAEGLEILLPAAAVAFLALALEAGLGTALVLAVRRLWVLVPTALLVAFFLFLTGRNYWLTAHGLRAPGADCGCFGNLVERTPAEAFWQDLVILGLPLALAFVGRPRGGRRVPILRTAAAAVVAVVAVGFAWKAPDLPLDDLATRLRPGAEVAELCAGAEGERLCLTTIVPELARGSHLVVLADLEDPGFTAAIDRLNAYAFEARDGKTPPLWVLSGDSLEQQRAFFWAWGPVFEVREAPPELLKPLYRRLPRSFLVEDGEVLRTYAGLPPLTGVDGGATLASRSG